MGSSAGGGVPPGFRFHPTDEELLHFYLKKKISLEKFDMEVIREVDLNKIEPWDLQEKCKIGSTPQNEWYFFSHKDRKYPTGSRTNRATSAGFWKATGRDKCIRNSFNKIGMRKTLVFYRGRAPHGQKTDWIMHEYRLEESNHSSSDHINHETSTYHHHHHHEDGWVVCRVFKKKNLFKVENNNNNSTSGIMMDELQVVNMSSRSAGGGPSSSSNNVNNTSSSAAINHYLLQSSHELSDHSDHHHHLNYSHIPLPSHHHHQYPQLLEVLPHDFISTQNHIINNIKPPPAPLIMLNSSNYDHHRNHLSDIPTATTHVADHNYDHHSPNSSSMISMQVKQFMSSNSRDRHDSCTAATDDDHAAAAPDHNYQPSCSEPATAGIEYNPPPSSSINQINQLSLRSEMDFWAYNNNPK